MRNYRFFMLLSLLLLAYHCLWAAPVDSVTARQVASRFYQWKSHSEVATQPVEVYTHYASDDAQRRSIPVFFIYNVDGGYVVVAADSRICPIIAYSTECSFELEQMSPAMMDIFDDYAEEIADYLHSSPADPAHPQWRQIMEQSLPSSRNEAVVPPLLFTRWDQNAYYNSLCPVDADGPDDHAYAGCVATAMAQVLRYWSYPAHGNGSHTDTCDYGNLYVNFGNGTYDYSLMPAVLNSSTPTAQVQEVAKLIYHCGVSVDMAYGEDGSSASTSRAATALTTYFGYTSNPSYIRRSQYTATTWKDALKAQLNQLRPMMYRGQSDAGGHSFVCDGYDDQDYFHFNWGWSGSNNGYFLLIDLTPGNHNFNTSQGAVINVFVERPMIKTSGQEKVLYSVNGSADTTSFRVISVNGSSQVTAIVNGNFTISDGTSPFADTVILSSGNQCLYVRYQNSSSTLQTQYGSIQLFYDTLEATVLLTGEVIPVEHAAPQAPNAVYTTPNVNLTWNPPAINMQTYQHGEQTHSSNYGSSSDYARTNLYRLCDTDLVAFYPARLTHITFYLRSAVTVCKLIVYKGGSYEDFSLNPGTLVVEQPLNLNQLNANSWNTVALQTPVPITLGEEIWYGIYIEAPGGTYTIPVGNTSTYVPEKGDIVCRHYSSGATSWGFYNVGRNFSLRAQFQSTPPTLSHYQIARDSLTLGTTANTYYNDVVTESGSYTYHIAAVYDDDAMAEVTTVINVQVISHVDTVTAQICEGDSYLFHGQVATTEGSYYYYANDTLTVLCLSLLPSSQTEENAETCDSYVWNGLVYDATGDYSMTFVNSHGCDSVVTLHLTVHPVPDLTLTASSTSLHYPESATLSVSGADYYQWSTGEIANQIVVCPTVPTTYSVTGSLSGSPCESADSVLIYTQGYGVEVYEQEVVCYPNPVSDVLFVSGVTCDRLLLYDAEGRLCQSWNGNREVWRLPMQQLAEGTYLLVGLQDEARRFATRVVVRH
ncbi:MAG: thiol protease/hemagglutinin PrtT [Bacteroidales bacterium]|nr:thiol protease/hemagglutinin PrtT [Bacteroidales bacterium]